MTILPISLYLNIPSEVASVIKEDKYEYLSKSSTQFNHYENRSLRITVKLQLHKGIEFIQSVPETPGLWCIYFQCGLFHWNDLFYPFQTDLTGLKVQTKFRSFSVLVPLR